ncbi:MAG TPA: hypothetical protein DCX39_04290 [Firmicutes bacterium]|nr:hypothetical protein [Bacillota bacterium]HAX00355.1 hypothetical protein [Bacillota bacterium]
MNRNNYDDIIDLPRHVSKVHPQMSISDRAAQFAPFSALTGYKDAIIEVDRYTQEFIELDDSEKEVIGQKLYILNEHKKENIQIEITYFEPDKKKKGGIYKKVQSVFKCYDELKDMIVLENNVKILVKYIIELKSDIFEN